MSPFAELIIRLNLSDYEIARRVGTSRSTISNIRRGTSREPGYSLGLKLAALDGIAIPGSLKALEK